MAVLAPAAHAQEEPAGEFALPKATSVREVRLEGNSAFKSKELLEAAGLLPTKKYYFWSRDLSLSLEEVAERLGEVALFYQRHGYFEARASLGGVIEGVALASVAEGEATRVEEVDLQVEPEGAWGPVTAADLLSELPLRAGEVFTVQDYEAAAEVAARAWKEVGYPFARVEPEAVVDRDAHRVRVLLRAFPGALHTVGEVRFEGAEGLNLTILRRAIPLQEGQPWCQTLADRGVEALYRLGIFEGVALAPESEGVEDGRVPVVVRVRQGSPHRIKLGVGYGTEDEGRIRFGWETARLWDRILAFSVDVKLSQLESSGAVSARRPYFADPFTALTAEAFLGERDEVDYNFRTAKARIGFDRQVGARWKWSLYAAGEKLLEVNPSESLSVAVPPAALDLSLLTSAAISVTRDTTDVPLDPRRGTILAAYAEPTLVDAGRRSFMKSILEGRAYLTPGKRATLALKLKLGYLVTGGDPDDIPVSKRFYAGGSMSVRGYAYNGIGPLADNGALLGGDALLESSAEVRFPFRESLTGILFLDAGNAFQSPIRQEALKLYAGAGFGVRLKTPVGPIGVDLGFKLRKDPKDSSPWALHVFVGYAF